MSLDEARKKDVDARHKAGHDEEIYGRNRGKFVIRISHPICDDRLQRHEITMALQLRPNCEYCDKDLPPDSMEARICSYECTFCADCVENKLHNVCPNCGGGFTPRPIRPANEWRPGLSVAKRPPSDKRVHLSWSLDELAEHSARIRDIPPEQR
jgi:hypothetical protein